MQRSAGLQRDDGWWLGLVALVALSHLAFLLLDRRVVVDDVELLAQVPVVVDGLRAGEPGRVLAVLGVPSGWLQLFIGGLGAVFGLSAPVVRGVFVLFTCWLVLNAGWLGRWLGGPRGALAAVATAALAPMITAWGRMAWYHVPEAALITGALVVWHADVRLQRRRSLFGVGVLLVLALALRTSALLWVATLAPVAGWLWRQGVRRPPAVLAAVLALASLPQLARLPAYVGDKLGARERYTFAVDGLGDQMLVMVTLPVLLVGLAGLVVAARRLREGGPEAALRLTALGWVAVAAVLVVVFRAGIDNHTLLALGLALGAAELRWGWVMGLLWVLQQVLLAAGLSWAPGVLVPQAGPDTRDYNHPAAVLDRDELTALFDASCHGRCVVAVEQGLFHPFSKGDEVVEVRQLGVPGVELVPVRDVGPRMREVAALASWRCTEAFADYRRLNPGDGVPAARLEQALGLAVVFTRRVSPECVLAWEMSEVPDGLPVGDAVDVPPRPALRPPPPR